MHFRAELIVYLRRCATRAFSLAQNLGTRSVADGVSTLGLLLVLLLIYYALPVVCTSRYILLAKRSILTCITGVVKPERSWTWSSVTKISFANVLSHLSCFIMNGICVWFCSVCVSGNSIPPIDMGPYSTAPGRGRLNHIMGRMASRMVLLMVFDCFCVKLVRWRG